jgi:hypothetical protein
MWKSPMASHARTLLSGEHYSYIFIYKKKNKFKAQYTFYPQEVSAPAKLVDQDFIYFYRFYVQ